MPTQVIHFRDWNRSDPRAIYIGREVPRKGLKRSPYANPFLITDIVDRETAIAWFDNWANNSECEEAVYIREHVEDLLDYDCVVCWCEPLACHGAVLIRMAQEARARRLAKLEAIEKERAS